MIDNQALIFEIKKRQERRKKKLKEEKRRKELLKIFFYKLFCPFLVIPSAFCLYKFVFFLLAKFMQICGYIFYPDDLEKGWYIIPAIICLFPLLLGEVREFWERAIKELGLV